MAVVLVIVGLIMMTVFPALKAVRSTNQRALTESNLHSLMLATASYVQANGCVPCPAIAGGTTTNFGKVGTPNNVACGACPAPEGITPFATLGIPSSTAKDGWGHWITMRVDPALTINFNVKPLAGSAGLCASGLSTTNRISVTTPGGATQKAAVLFVSAGTTGYGSYFAQPSSNANNGYTLPFGSNYAACNAGGYAQCNAAGTTQFYDSPAYNGTTDSYDDLLTYADRNTLVSLFGNGSCQTVW